MISRKDYRVKTERTVFGQKHNVTYIDFMIPETVDERIVKALRNKIDIASSVMGEEAKEWLM